MKMKWSPEKVNDIQKYMREKAVTLEQASKDLKFGMATYYRYKAMKPSKQVSLNVEPYYNILPNQKSNKVVIVITDVSQVKNVINEMF